MTETTSTIAAPIAPPGGLSIGGGIGGGSGGGSGGGDDLAKLLETELNVDKQGELWIKAEKERLDNQQKKMDNMFGSGGGGGGVSTAVRQEKTRQKLERTMGLNSGGVTTSGLISAMAQATNKQEQKKRNKVSMEEKKKLMKAKRTMPREEYNKVAKDYSEKYYKRKNDEVGGVSVGDPAGDEGTFNTLLSQLQLGVSTGRMSEEQGSSLTKALGKAETMLGKMNKSQRAMFQSMMSAQGLSSFLGATGPRPATELDLGRQEPVAEEDAEEEEQDDSGRTARQKKNRKKREKYREKKRALLKKQQEEANKCQAAPTSST